MSTYAVQGETLGLIADAIRGKLGTDEPMEVSSMASAIESIPSGGSGFVIGEFELTMPSSAVTIAHNLNTTKLMLQWKPVGDVVTNEAYKAVMGMATTIDPFNVTLGGETAELFPMRQAVAVQRVMTSASSTSPTMFDRASNLNFIVDENNITIKTPCLIPDGKYKYIIFDISMF